VAVTAVGLDADDTLWHNESVFRLTHERFAVLLADHADAETLDARLAATEARNLRLYGYGVKGFTLSMIETALEVTDGRAPGHVIQDIWLRGGRCWTTRWSRCRGCGRRWRRWPNRGGGWF
jgi:putative hydrolase of the HAD superfamily